MDTIGKSTVGRVVRRVLASILVLLAALLAVAMWIAFSQDGAVTALQGYLFHVKWGYPLAWNTDSPHSASH